MNVSRVQENLRTEKLGRKIIFSRRIGSTNDLAKKLATYGAVEGTVVVADTQDAGRGRLNRNWVSPKGGLWFSLILRPKCHPTEATRLVFVACLAVAETLSKRYGLKVETRWPNDVVVNGRKICGILAEMNTIGEAVNHVIVGVGINANFDAAKAFPESLRTPATSLKSELGNSIRLGELLGLLLERLEIKYHLFVSGDSRRIIDEWKAYAAFLGRKINVACENGNLRGVALDVDYDGAFILKLEDGIVKRILVGDVTVQED